MINFNDWVDDVDTKWTPRDGLFSDGSAEEIANSVLKGHNNELKSSIASINFYLNRGGKNLSSSRKKVLESAKDIIRNKVSKLNNFNKSIINSMNKLFN